MFLGDGRECSPPIKYPTLYDSWYECARGAQTESLKILSKGGYKYVNDYKVATKYSCMEVRTY